jgi:hypothetical protein
VLWGLAAFGAAFVVGSAAVCVVVAIAAADFLRSFDDIGKRDHLTPIPIAKSACPYVVAMHDAANEFQNEVGSFDLAVLLYPPARPWPQSRPALRHAADVLDVTIAAGIPHVPPPVRTYLTRVRIAIDEGRRAAAVAATPNAFVARVEPLIAKGRREFGYAGDLIGHACSVDLGADSAPVSPGQ